MEAIRIRHGLAGVGALLLIAAGCPATEPAGDGIKGKDRGAEQPAPLTCSDGIKDGDETSLDCGGSCPQKCSFNQDCGKDGDCQSGSCDPATKKCRLAPCSDGTKDGDETDTDCGGSCSVKCGDGQGCAKDGDCKSGSCDSATKKCKASQCSDGIKDGDETDLDCGGSCPQKCGYNQGCAKGGDCQSGACDTAAKKCTTGSCGNAVQDGDETGLDCGGSCPDKCGYNQGCAKDADCQSGRCDTANKKCGLPLCSDGLKSGDETDIDCGGSCPLKCGHQAGCAKDSDCLSNKCLASDLTTNKCQ